MSASIYWIPVVPQNRHAIEASAPSSFIEKLQKVFNQDRPVLLAKEDAATLQAMYVASGDKEWKKLADACVEFGGIQIDWIY